MKFNSKKIGPKTHIIKDNSGSFKAHINGKEIELCFVVEIIDTNRVLPGDHEKPITITLNIFPVEKEVSEKYKSKVSRQDTYSHIDAIDYGSTAPVDPEVYNTSEEALVEGNQLCFDSLEKAETYIKQKLPRQCEKIASMVGFHLDKPWNRMGENGWDTLQKMTN